MTTTIDSSIVLNDEQERLRKIIEEGGQHIFITGKAGTGKSTLLQEFKRSTQKRAVLVAPTGVAALNIGGQTIHSLFRIKPAEFIDPAQLRTMKATKDLLAQVDTLIIDEVSMVRADLMDAMDQILKFSKRSHQPFGGVQVIMFGDLFQLPPVVRGKALEEYFETNYGGIYFFNAKVWQEVKIETYELDTSIRQEHDQEFVEILNAIRDKDITADIMTKLNQRVRFKPEDDNHVTLALTNKAVNDINEAKLKAIESEELSYVAEIEGKLSNTEYPTDKTLRLKESAQVMFLKNDRDGRYVNGSIGRVIHLSKDAIEVELEDNIINVRKESWEKIRYSFDPATQEIKAETISSFKQYPLKLAWAITVHKSQGQTLDNVVLDMGFGAFAHGQTYVALSRCRSLDSLFLKRPIRDRDVIVDNKVIEFLK